MTKDIITSSQIQEFLKDFRDNSEMILLEEGKEMSELFEIAEARGIKLKNSRDLAGVKLVYTFADKANKNKARLPEKELLKALPSLIGKPVDIDHDRRYVIGSFIDYKWIVKEKKVIAYAILFKSNFTSEWEEMQKLFKAGKLTSSYEIWSDHTKRKVLEDGTYELYDMEIAGGAILLKESPAFPGAKILEIAKQNFVQHPDLVFASYKDEDIIIAETIATETPKVVAPVSEPKPKIKCSNCGKEYDKPSMNEFKCSDCFAILNQEGQMIYPPQIIDFSCSCSKCNSRNWRLLERSEKEIKAKCMSCAKEFKLTIKEIIPNEAMEGLDFIHIGSVSCKQCGKELAYSRFSSMTKYNMKCNKCGLEFVHDFTYAQKKAISKIEEIISKADELKIDKSAIKSEVVEGEAKVETKEEVKIEKAVETPQVEAPKAEEKIAEAKVPSVEEVKPAEVKAEEKPAEQAKEEPKAEVKVEEPKKEEAKTEEKKEEVVEPKVEAKPVEEAKKEEPKAEEAPKEETKVEEQKPIEEAKKEEKKECSKCKEYEAKIEELEKKMKWYKENAVEISKRREELGEFAKEISDIDILDVKKYSDAKLAKANKEIEKSAEIVGNKITSDDEYARYRKEIIEKSEGRVRRSH